LSYSLTPLAPRSHKESGGYPEGVGVRHAALTPLAPLSHKESGGYPEGMGEGYMPLSGIVSRTFARVGCKRKIFRYTRGAWQGKNAMPWHGMV
jgi:hypothetical protein